ncbi:MAG: NAD(P)-dependent glycerol-3-phosphate dehydrogenase [Candidatus Aureabacteria bacterium]|nr:NAD(P)-dependent glycerol-3-phosphate dehydrogenase [Candidatus Auribacterota bacterium]
MMMRHGARAPGVAVLGDGGWGTTLAILLHRKGIPVTLWGAFPAYAEFLRRGRINRKFLPGVPIPAGIPITALMDQAVNGAGAVILAVPSHHMRAVCRRLAAIIPPVRRRRGLLVISGAKGIETRTMRRMSQVIGEELAGVRMVALSGPSHAEEVVRESPATVVVASRNSGAAEEAQRLLMTERFRVYTNPDLTGVEIGGAIKNVIAIAAGACDGLGFGDNAKAALITRGIVEITRLGVAMGARAATFSGLTGIGDLITTCVSRYGRNRKVGEMIARGKKAARKLARRFKVEMPITEQVYSVLYRGKDPATAVRELMMRRPRAERY